LRPDRLVLIAGTATDIGKTWVGVALLTEARRRGLSVAARKPAQSFAPDSGIDTDADLLARAAGESPGRVCPAWRSYPVPMAPPMAAQALGLAPFTVADLVGELIWPPDVALGLVESVGGVRSPLADDGDTVDLARAVAPDVVVLVADAGLGTINVVRLCLDVLAQHRVVVYLNRFDEREDLDRRNRAWLVERLGAAVVTDVGCLVDAVISADDGCQPDE
jgi:dethiobiotin synthetase